MSSAPTSRRAVAEIDFSGSEFSAYKIGNRSIHGFWHLFSAHFRHVLVTPQRRPDSGRVAWTWREAPDGRPATAAELAEVRRRLSDARGLLAGNPVGSDREEGGGNAVATLEAQVISIVSAMVGRLVAERDFALARFVCRTETGLMVHSWGSPVAAVPHFPDVHGGEISGTVSAASGRPMEARVVLLNKTGTQVAGVDSHRDGRFRFPDVAAGSYRIHVQGRSDFPEEGLPVNLDQGSVTGLELRAAASPPSRGQGSKRRGNGSSAWYFRPMPLAVLVLAILAAGGTVWLYLRVSGARALEGQRANVFQVANGPLVGGDGHDKDTTHRGLGSGWPSFSDLARALRSPFSRKSASAIAATGAAARSGVASTEAGLDRPVASDASARADNLGDSQNPPDVGSGNPADSEGRSPTEGNRVERAQPASEARLAGARSRAGRPADARPIRSQGTESGRVAAKSPDRASAEAAAGGAGTEAEPGTSSAAATTTTVANRRRIVAVAPSISEQSPAAAGPSPSVGAGADPGAPGADAGGDAVASIASSPAGDSSNGRSVSDRGMASKAGPGPAPASANSMPEADASEVMEAHAVADNSKARQPSKAETVPPKATPANPNRAASTSEPAAPAQPATDTPAEEALEGTRATGKAVSPRPEVASTRIAPPKVSTLVKASSGPFDPESRSDPGSPATNSTSSRAEGSRTLLSPTISPAKPVAAPRAQGSDDDPTMTGATASLGDANPEQAIPKTAPTLIRIGRLRASSWSPQVFQDIILPTRPVPISQAEAVEAMKEGLRKERLALMPTSFRSPQVKRGFSFVFSAGAKDAPVWHGLLGAAVVATVQGNRAELTLSSGQSAPQTYVLACSDGREIAQVIVSQDGTPALNAAPGTHSWYWLGVEHPKAEGTFAWRLTSGGSVPESWARDDHWQGERGQRIDIPLDPSGRGSSRYSIALVDPSTGCGITCAVDLE